MICFSDYKSWRVRGLSCDHVYVLNMDRSADRMAAVRVALENEAIEFERFAAIDGTRLILKHEERHFSMKMSDIRDQENFFANSGVEALVTYPGFEQAGFRYIWSARWRDEFLYPYNVSPGELGCWYSHRAMWADMLKRGYKAAVILEDDVKLLPGFKSNLQNLLKSIPDDADIVYIDFTGLTDNSGIVRSVEGSPHIGRVHSGEMCLGTHAYIVTENGAKKLLLLTSTMGMPLDVALSIYSALGQVERYVSMKKIAGADEHFISEIAKMGRKLGAWITLDFLRRAAVQSRMHLH